MIKSARLQHFRTYSDRTFEFSPGVNIITGPNGSGKTNLLEAIIVLARGNSFRAKDPDLIEHKRSWARLDGSFETAPRTVKIKRQEHLSQKEFEVDDKIFKRLSLDKTIPVVYFEPNHLGLITRGPSERREMLDELLELTKPDFKRLSASYRRTLAQRNTLLKRGRFSAHQQLFAWDVRLGELGSQIALAREELAKNLNKDLGQVYSSIAGSKTKAEIKYKIQFPATTYASQMINRLGRTLEQDLLRGFTGTGPHREDFVFKIDDQPISTSASRGEIRSLFLALKLLELKLIEEVREQKPILLLDDVFSELDTKRRKALIKATQSYQTILTTTEADTIANYFKTKKHKIIKIKKPAS